MFSSWPDSPTKSWVVGKPSSCILSVPTLQSLAADAAARFFDVYVDHEELTLIASTKPLYVLTPYLRLPAELQYVVLQRLAAQRNIDTSHFLALLDTGLLNLDFQPFPDGVVCNTVLDCATRCTQLRSVHLNDSKRCSSKAVGALLSRQFQHTLTTVDISGGRSCDDNVLAILARVGGSLQHLYLRGSAKVTDKGLDVLKGCPKLALLDISFCQQVTLIALPEFAALTALNAEGTGLSDASFTSGAHRFRILNLALTNISDATLSALAASPECMQHLRWISVGGCTNVSSDGVGKLTGSTRGSLKHINVGSVTMPSWSAVQRIVHSVGLSLTHLNLSRAHGVWLVYMGLNLPCIQSLDLSFCTGIRDFNDVGYMFPDGVLAPDAVAMPTLRRMVFRGARVSMDADADVVVDEPPPKLLTSHIARVLQRCHRLEEIDLAHCEVTNAQLQLLTAAHSAWQPDEVPHDIGGRNSDAGNVRVAADRDGDSSVRDARAGFSQTSEDPVLLLLRLNAESQLDRENDSLHVGQTPPRKSAHRLAVDDSMMFEGSAANDIENAAKNVRRCTSDSTAQAVDGRSKSVPFGTLRWLDLGANNALTYFDGLRPAVLGTERCTLTAQLQGINLAECRGISRGDVKHLQRLLPEVQVSWT
eukprot:m.521136 g.521136  ORF g.521136 m.521136 type:complete len:647 (+) comp21958_c0_seq3:167-2107(+)